MDRRKDEALVHIRERSIEVFALIDRAIMVILAVHNLEIELEALLNLLDDVAFRGVGIYWLSSFPVVPR